MNTLKHLSFHSLFTFVAVSLLVVGCDKIDENDYTVYDGAVINWTEGDGVATHVQRVYVEKFTGPHCNNCTKADETLATVHDPRVVIVSINHTDDAPFPNQPDMRTDGGNAWDAWLGINAIPAAYINRDRSTQYQSDMANIIAAIDNALLKTPSVAMDVNASLGTDVTVTVDLQFLEDINNDLTLTAAITEDSLKYKQLLFGGGIDAEYAHNHMLRKVITGFWGRDIEAATTTNSAVKGTFHFSPSSDIVLENAHIVVFVSDKSSRKVLNCASCKIDLLNDKN